MKRYFALFFLTLLCSRPVLAFGHPEVGQFYDGEAKPRAEVAWVWIKGDLHISQIDHFFVQMSNDRDAFFSEGIFLRMAIGICHSILRKRTYLPLAAFLIVDAR